MKKSLIIIGQFIWLWMIAVIGQAVSSRVFGLDKLFAGKITPADMQAAGMAMLIIQAAFMALLLWVAHRSAWRGWKLAGTVFLVYFGVSVFLTQIESLVFLEQLVNILPAGVLPVLILEGTITAAIMSLLVVWVAGKFKGASEETEKSRLAMSKGEWLVKLGVLGVTYYLIYIWFGAHVMLPLAGPAEFAAYYKNLHMPAWMPFFQFGRGLIWVGIALPVILMHKGKRWEAGLMMALLFSCLMGLHLITPLPFMPKKIRLAHLVEVLSSNFLWGWIVVYLLTWHKRWDGRKNMAA